MKKRQKQKSKNLTNKRVFLITSSLLRIMVVLLQCLNVGLLYCNFMYALRILYLVLTLDVEYKDFLCVIRPRPAYILIHIITQTAVVAPVSPCIGLHWLL